MRQYSTIIAINAAILILYFVDPQYALALCYSGVGAWLVWQFVRRRRWTELGAGFNFLIIAWRVQLSELVGAEFWTQFHIWAIIVAMMMVVVDAVAEQYRD